jgi:hypothetical protein
LVHVLDRFFISLQRRLAPMAWRLAVCWLLGLGIGNYDLQFSTGLAMRNTGACADCGKRKSAKAYTHCFDCTYKHRKPRGPTGVPSWNRGRTRFASEEHRREETNRLRRERRRLKSTQEHIADRIRTLIRNGLRKYGQRKDTKTAILLGCSIIEFRAHLEAQFRDGMGWHNYGNLACQWNIDHIRPLCTFDLSNRKQQLEAFHFMNCRPLWAAINSARSRPGRKAA